jgi:hypothetical protein
MNQSLDTVLPWTTLNKKYNTIKSSPGSSNEYDADTKLGIEPEKAPNFEFQTLFDDFKGKKQTALLSQRTLPFDLKSVDLKQNDCQISII